MTNSNSINDLKFNLLPAFALYIIDNRLEEYVREQIRLGRELKLPILEHFKDYSEDDLVEVSKTSSLELLTYFSNNSAYDLIQNSIKKWVADQLPQNIRRSQLSADDITLISYIRKQSLLKLLPGYSTDLQVIMEVSKELDQYILHSDSAAIKTYMNIMDEKVKEHLHFIEKIAETAPGVVYVYDLVEEKEIYTNGKVKDLLGYSEDDYKTASWKALQHPDDLDVAIDHLNKISALKDFEVRIFEHRIKHKSNDYIWVRDYQSIFKRDENGKPTQIIGLAMNIEDEKKLGKELKTREEQLLEAQKLAEIGSFYWNLTNNQSVSTPQLKEILQTGSDSNLSSFMDRVHPLDKKQVEEALDRALKVTGEYDAEFRFIGKDENQQKVLWSRGVVTYKDGQPFSMKGTVMDVTERHQMLQQLKTSEALYKQAQALTHIGNWTWDLRQNEITWTDELYRIFGLVPQSIEIKFDDIFSYLHPKDKVFFVESVEQIKKSGSPEKEYLPRIILKDGSIKTLCVKTEVTFDENGVPCRLSGTAQDISRQKLDEKKLRDNENFIKKITDATPSIIAAYNINSGKYLFINEAFEKLLGYPPARVLAEGSAFFAGIMHPEDIPGIMEQNRIALEAANNHTIENNHELIFEFKYRLRNKNGDYRWFHTYGTIFDRNDKNQVEHVLNISIDITDRKKIEETLYHKTMELQQSNANLEEFAYVASHDLKEPLRKITTFGDRLLVREKDSLKDESKTYLQKIIESSRRMQRMIDDLLSISMISGEKTFEPYSLQVILKEVIQTLEFKIEESKASIQSDNLPVATIIPSQFRQLFQNLISNGLKFRKHDVEPVISISHKQLTGAEVDYYQLNNSKKYIQLNFVDNGIGFDEKNSEKIFSIFHRLHGRSEYEGTGIGLAICKKIIENHSGRIFANSRENEGSNFTVIIPL